MAKNNMRPFEDIFLGLGVKFYRLCHRIDG